MSSFPLIGGGWLIITLYSQLVYSCGGSSLEGKSDKEDNKILNHGKGKIGSAGRAPVIVACTRKLKRQSNNTSRIGGNIHIVCI